jgi:Flagellar motor switch protein FliM
VTPLEFTIESHETEPQLLRILAPHETVVVFSMEVRIGDNYGMMNIGIPLIVVEMLRNKFDQQRLSIFRGVALLAADPSIHVQLGSRRLIVEPGWHFRSRYPGNPTNMMVYDFVRDLLLEEVANLDQFLGVLAFDKWIGNADGPAAFFALGAFFTVLAFLPALLLTFGRASGAGLLMFSNTIVLIGSFERSAVVTFITRVGRNSKSNLPRRLL